jgi:hypothetical protein
MTDYFWPTTLVPNTSEWRFIANTAAFSSPLTGTTRTVGRGGDRWAATLTFNNLTSSNRSHLQSFLTQLRGQANRVYVYDHAYRFNVLPDLLSYTPWTAQYSALTLADGIARIQATSHTAGQFPWIYTTSAFVVENAATYAVRCFFTRSSTGTASMGPYAHDGITPTSSYSTAAGLRTVTKVVAAPTCSYAVVIDSTATSTAVGDYAVVPYVSMSRCMTVNGGSQTGLILNVTGQITDFSLLPGDRVEVNGEYHEIVEALWASAGSGHIRLARPLRSSPANGAAVVVHEPLCKMMLADSTVGWSNSPGGRSSATVDLIEDIA